MGPTGSSGARPRRRSWRRLLLPTLLGLALLEIGVRVTDPVPSFGNRMWRWHPVLGWSQTPNEVFHFTVDGRAVTVEFNSAGFRGEDHPQSKPPDVRRLVVLGDSHSEAVQVNLDEIYWRRLEEMLNTADERWEVINLGVGDFGTAQACIALEEIGLRYEPDLVLCQICPLNDIGNNTIELAGLCMSANDPLRPYFIEREGELVHRSVAPLRASLRQWSATFRWVERMFIGGNLPSLDEVGALRDAELARRGFGLDPLLQVYVGEEHQCEEVRQGWRITERLFERMATTCAQRGIPLTAVVIPFGVRVGDHWEEFARMFDPVLQRDVADARLKSVFDRLGVPLVLPRDALAREKAVTMPFLDGHMNAEGHRVVAEQILATLRAQKLVD